MDIILAGVFITYQCVLLDYPLEAAIRSALDLCDYVVINDGGSTDGTLELLEALGSEYGKDRVNIIHKKWIHNRGFWARERNYVLKTIPLEHYVVNLAADECFHEDDLITIRSLIPRLHGRAMRFIPLHFYGKPNYIIKGKHWATVLTKLWQNRNGIFYYNIPHGCADDPLWPDGSSVHWNNCLDSNIKVYHYGHCRDPKAVAMKNEKAHSLYRNEDFYVDGSFPIIKEFDYQLEKYLIGYGGDKAYEFKGKHPKYIKVWCERHATQKLSYRA